MEPGTAFSTGSVPASDLAEGGDGARAFQDDRDDRAGGDEFDERAEERALGVLGVVLGGELLGDVHLLQGRELQTLALDAGDDLPDEAAGHAVGLDEYQRLLSHKRNLNRRALSRKNADRGQCPGPPDSGDFSGSGHALAGQYPGLHALFHIGAQEQDEDPDGDEDHADHQDREVNEAAQQ